MIDEATATSRGPTRARSSFDGAFLLNPPRPRVDAVRPARSVTGAASGRSRVAPPRLVVSPAELVLPVVVGLVSGLVVGRMAAQLPMDPPDSPARLALVIALAVVLAASAGLAARRGTRRAAVLLWAFLIGVWPVPLLAIGMLLALLAFA